MGCNSSKEEAPQGEAEGTEGTRKPEAAPIAVATPESVVLTVHAPADELRTNGSDCKYASNVSSQTPSCTAPKAALAPSASSLSSGGVADAIEESILGPLMKDTSTLGELDGDMGLQRASAFSKRTSVEKLTLDDFEVGRLLGKGAFGKVRLAKHKYTGATYAIKSLNKKMLVAVKQVNGALTEKAVLQLKGHPYVVRLHYAFQDHESLHMVLDYMPGGDLFDRIEAEQGIPLERVRLYAAQVCLALTHLHDVLKVIYRDLKPENILLDAQGNARLTDFGLAKTAERGRSFCGSTEYMAPEVVLAKDDHDKTVDWWGLGVLIHEMLTAKTPFDDENHRIVMRKIAEPDEPIVLADIDAEAARFIMLLLDREPKTRLGAGPSGSNDVKADAFWAPIDFVKLYNKEYKPEWKPLIPEDYDRPADEADAEAGDGEEGASDGDIEGETDSDDSGDEWHLRAPTGAAGHDDDYTDLFRGFTFRRENSVLNMDALTRSTSRVRRSSFAATTSWPASRTTSVSRPD
mmetsp:Transcript_24480/g.58979  ORF Transcript_24480/g.58979 Transcript_24480/m.58979 type:complete len:519 (+) Transcript_24480:14-1570(+)